MKTVRATVSSSRGELAYSGSERRLLNSGAKALFYQVRAYWLFKYRGNWRATSRRAFLQVEAHCPFKYAPIEQCVGATCLFKYTPIRRGGAKAPASSHK